MTDRELIPPAPGEADHHAPDTTDDDASTPGELTAEQARRWALLVADGKDEIPADLPPADRQRLVVEVRRALRDRLMDLVAHAIALDLMRASGVVKEDRQ